MTLPAYGWLLALVVVVQALFFLKLIVVRMRGKGVQPLARPVLALLCLSWAAGLFYGVVQRDPLFFIGQACLFILYYQIYRERNDH